MKENLINSLIERALDVYRNGMGLYLQEAEGLQEQKEKNKEKIKEKSFITVLITAIRTVFNEELAKKFYFDEAEVEDLRTKLEDYKKATEDIYNYDFKTDIIDIIAEGLASQNLSLEVIEDILNSDVVDALEKLGLSDQMPVLRQKINQIIKSQNDSKKTWELSDEEKERAAMQKQLKKMLDSLTDRQREAVYLRYTQGLSYEEIGKLMGIQPKAAQKLVYRAIEQMRKIQPQIIYFFKFHFIGIW